MVSTEWRRRPWVWRLMVGGGVASVEFAAAGKVAERVDVGAVVGAERECVGGGTGAGGRHIVAVQFGQAVDRRRMVGMMRHPGVKRLGEVENPRGAEERE